MATKPNQKSPPKKQDKNSAPGFLHPLREAWRDDRSFIFLILVLSIGLPLLHLWFIRRMPNFNVPIIDSLDYFGTARDLLDPQVIPEPYYHSPLYVWFVAAIFKFFGIKILTVRYVQVVVHCATALLVYMMGRRMFSKTAGRTASLIFCLYGPILFFNTEILNVCLILFLNFLGVYLVFHAWSSDGMKRWIAAGLALGLAVAARADVLVFVMLTAAALLFFARKFNFQTRLLQSAALFAGTILLLLIVGGHNKKVSGRFTMLPGNGGINFFQGNNPNYKETIGIRIASWYTISHMPLAEGATTEMNELGQSPFYYQKASQFIREQPGDWIGCVIYKIRALINGYELPETFDVYTYAKHSPVLTALTWKAGIFYFPYALLFPLAIFGIWTTRKNPATWWLLAYVVAMLVSLLGYWNSARYRLALVPAFILWSAAVLEWLREKYKAKETSQLLAFAGAFIFLSVASLWPLDHFSKRFNFEAELTSMAGLEMTNIQPESGIPFLRRAAEMDPNSYFVHNNLGEGLKKLNRLDEAAAEFQKSIELNPRHYIAYENLGKALGMQDKRAEALQAFQRVLELFPRSYPTYFSVAVTLVRDGRNEEAIPYLRRALEINPDYLDALLSLGTIFLQKNESAEATPLFQRALAIDPNSEKAQAGLRFAQNMPKK